MPPPDLKSQLRMMSPALQEYVRKLENEAQNENILQPLPGDEYEAMAELGLDEYEEEASWHWQW